MTRKKPYVWCGLSGRWYVTTRKHLRDLTGEYTTYATWREAIDAALAYIAEPP